MDILLKLSCNLVGFICFQSGLVWPKAFPNISLIISFQEWNGFQMHHLVASSIIPHPMIVPRHGSADEQATTAMRIQHLEKKPPLFLRIPGLSQSFSGLGILCSNDSLTSCLASLCQLYSCHVSSLVLEAKDCCATRNL